MTGKAMEKAKMAHGIPLPPIIANALIKVNKLSIQKAYFTVLNTLNTMDTASTTTDADPNDRYIVKG